MVIRYAVVVILFMSSPAFAQDASTAMWTPIYEVFSHPVAQTAMSVRTICRCGLDPAMGPSRGRME